MKYIKLFEQRTLNKDHSKIREVVDEFRYIVEDEGFQIRCLKHDYEFKQRDALAPAVPFAKCEYLISSISKDRIANLKNNPNFEEFESRIVDSLPNCQFLVGGGLYASHPLTGSICNLMGAIVPPFYKFIYISKIAEGK